VFDKRCYIGMIYCKYLNFHEIIIS
jgi:hypothetical protein